MKTPLFSRSGAIAWSSATIGVAVLSICALLNINAPSKDLEDANRSFATGRLALAYNETLPQWLAIPERSNKPLVRTIGINSNTRIVAYRTLLDQVGVIEFHQNNLAWKGLEWLEFSMPQRNGAVAMIVSVGHNSLTGERIQISVREIGHVRAVEITVSEQQNNLTASVEG